MRKALVLAVAVGMTPLLTDASLAQAPRVCDNDASTCTAARAYCLAVRTRIGAPVSDCEPAFKRCMRDGSWRTSVCNRRGLKKV